MKQAVILHGGRIKTSVDGGKAYFAEIVKNLGKTPRLLLCFFAQPREEWESRYEELQNRISSLLDCQPAYSMATPAEYYRQAGQSDALLMSGGDATLLHTWADRTSGFIESLRSLPVIAGSSAGADLLVEKFWACDWRTVQKGLGIVKTNLMVHYGSQYGSLDPRGSIDWQKAEAELRASIGPAAVITKLQEGEFKIFGNA